MGKIYSGEFRCLEIFLRCPEGRMADSVSGKRDRTGWNTLRGDANIG